MASRRTLKKNIKQICNSLFADCLVLQLVDQADHKTIDALMHDLVALNQEYVSRISHTQPGNEKVYYRKLRQEFTAQANRIAQAIVKA